MRAGATAVRGHVWPVDVAQARAPPPLATRVARGGGRAGKGTTSPGHVWSCEAAQARATAVRGHVWPVDVAQARAPPYFWRGHVW